MAVISAENAARASKYKLGSFEAFFPSPEMSSGVTFFLLAPPRANKHPISGALSSLRRGADRFLLITERFGLHVDKRRMRRGAGF